MTADSADRSRSLARSGPAFAQVEALGPIDWEAWARAADELVSSLPAGPSLDRRVHHLYLPVLFFSLTWLRRAASRPLMIGLQAPQGSGKTTLVRHLLALLPGLGLRGTGVSIDDFYLTRSQQLTVAAAHPGNPYFEHRGFSGTHDVSLGATILASLRALGEDEPDRQVAVPVYDKSAHAGRGDRAPESEWRAVRAPLDLVFVEGWMLGYTPVHESALADPLLAVSNRALAAYTEWHRLLDVFVILRASATSFIVDWRVQAEEAMRAHGRAGLDRAAIEDYIRRFLPAYETYGGAPRQFPADRQLTIWLDAERRAVPHTGS
jgi:D-glycerate 3-kinase